MSTDFLPSYLAYSIHEFKKGRKKKIRIPFILFRLEDLVI